MLRGAVRKISDNQIAKVPNASIHNRFDIEVRDAKTNEIKQKAEAYNVICSQLWSRLSSYFNYIAYGDGSGTPSSSDKTLFGTWYSASASDHDSQCDLTTGIAYRTRKITLNETTAVGLTITEVGLAWNNASGYLCTHAMIQDMNGNPISITKTSTDIITIYATVYVHWSPSGYYNNKIYLGKPGQSSGLKNFIDYLLGYGFTIEYGLYLDAYEYVGKGTNVMTSCAKAGSCTDSTKKIAYTFKRIPVDAGNVVGGFGWVVLMDNDSSGSTTYCVIDVRGEYRVTGEAVGSGDGTTKAFATLFDLPTNAVVYVDGVAQTSGVTVKKEPITTNSLEFLVRIENRLYEGSPIIIAGRAPISTTTPVYFYNTLAELGIYKCVRRSTTYPGAKLSFSDDFVNWSDDYSYGTVIPEEHRHKKYVRMLSTGSASASGDTSIPTGTFPPEITGKNIVFDTAPAAGSVITIDYTTPFVPKDANHVYDLNMAIQLGEYSEN